MVDKIVSILKELGVRGYEITDVVTRGWEFYFIRHQLDQNRAKNVETIEVKLYETVEDGVGTASMMIPPTASEEEVRALLVSLKERASLVKNNPYPLRKAQVKLPDPSETVDVAGIAKDFVSVMQSIPETETEDINSYEIFVSEKRKRFVTSEGIDVTEVFPSSMIEVVVNARNEAHEIELYRNYRSGSCDKEGIKKDILRTMQYGKDRLNTQPTPQLGKFNCLFSTSDAISIYRYFAARLDTGMVARKMSDYTLEKPISEELTGDKITLSARKHLPNSSMNLGFDQEGAPIRDLTLLDQGVPKAYVGGAMFSSYLGVEDSFMPTNLVVEGGAKSEEELRQGDYLELVEFSAFQADPMTGNIFGEIRLGYLHQGGKVTVISGGSVSGTMTDFLKDMEFSKETVQYNTWQIPSVTLLKNVTITGIQ